MSTLSQNTQSFEFKAVNTAMNIDEAKGIVECFVAAIGNKDSVGDIIVPGAFDESLKRRKPRVVWGHDWNQPIGKVLEIFEVGPSDPRLPVKMKAAGVGGLYARVQFNLKSERGREAFSNLIFFGDDQEWSIGYKTLDAVYDNARKANILKTLELYEVSPVLHGANQLTATISLKSAESGTGEKIDSFRKSKWKTFDPEFAEMIRTEHPEIWGLGGNIKGNDQYQALKPVLGRGGKATSQAEMDALELREAWVARHYEDFRPAGVMAQIKWFAVGSRGEDYMKNVIREEIAKREKAGKTAMGSSYEQADEDGKIVLSEFGKGQMMNRELAIALAAHLGGSVRLREVDQNLIVFDRMEDDKLETMRIGYHFDGENYMFGQPEKVKPTVVYLPGDEDGDGESENNEEGFGMESVKAPLPPDVVPQERFTGDVLRGRGPRRGNLERLLRYWRPIMRREGGFRRCRVILADHPELYPLNNICAWLHHETTGLWPNEGCHHPGMKNCRRKLKNIVRGSIVSDSDFERRMRELTPGKSAEGGMGNSGVLANDMYGDVTEDDIMFANKILREFMDSEKDFMDYLADDSNWVHVGDSEDDGMESEHEWMRPQGEKPCDCGCNGMKSDDDDLDVKIGRSVSNANTVKIQQAISLLQQVVGSSIPDVEMKKKQTLQDFISPVLEYHNIKAIFDGNEMEVQNFSQLTKEAMDALSSAVTAYEQNI